MRLLNRYIVRAILAPVAVVLAVLLTLGGVYLFQQQQDDIGQGSYTSADAFVHVLLNLPDQAWELLPLAALVGSLLGLGSLARGSEITVIRAGGVSPVRIAGSALIAAVLLIGIEVAPSEGTYLYSLMWFGHNKERTLDELPHHMIVDRCYVHGDPKKGSRRGVALNGRHLAVIDSYLSDFKEVGGDSQAILGWGGAGPGGPPSCRAV